MIDGAKEDLAAMARAVAIPTLTNEQILQAQRHMLAANSRIEAWEQCLALPQRIIAAATENPPPTDEPAST
jgi:hypothetical protein